MSSSSLLAGLFNNYLGNETFLRISTSQQAIAFRNRLVHGYDAIDHQTVWETVQNDLPTLKADTEQLLGDER